MSLSRSTSLDAGSEVVLEPVENASSSWRPLLVLVLLVILAHLPYLTGVIDGNPQLVDLKLATHFTGGLLPGGPYIDPNAGFTGQALGHRAMLDWTQGVVPWWNPYEGAGVPLAGEMQSAAFFPLNFLLLMANGQMWLYLVLDLIGAVSTFLLLRRLGVRSWLCVAAGLAFGLNGTMAWFRYQAANPVCFLPLLLLGIERCRASVLERRWRGWGLVAIALVLSLLAGFPETAFLDGLTALVWCVARCTGLEKRQLFSFLRRLGAGVATGLLVAGPVLVAFVDYLRNGFITPTASVVAHAFLTRAGIGPLLFPYMYGPIFGFGSYEQGGQQVSSFWGSVGGYLTGTLVLLAAIGLLGTRYRVLRVLLGIWALLVAGRIFGITPARQIFNLIPGASFAAAYRYGYPSLELAVVVLAALGMQDLVSERRSRRRIAAVIAAVVVVCLLALRRSLPVARNLVGAPHAAAWWRLSIAWEVLLMGGIAAVALAGGRRITMAVLSTAVCIDALAMFVVPELSAPRGGRVDTPAISFLQSHLGTDRFFSLGRLAPNYGSYFGLASLNSNDVPVPKTWNAMVDSLLDPATHATLFTGFTSVVRKSPTPLAALVKYVGHYEALGVKYVIIRAAAPAPRLDGQGKLELVYRDSLVKIYQLPSTLPVLHSAGRACKIVILSVDSARTDCSRPDVIYRSEIYMPGWTATVDGHGVPLTPTDDGLQRVTVPAGRSNLSFSFTPLHVDLSLVGVGLAALFCLVPFLIRVIRARAADDEELAESGG